MLIDGFALKVLAKLTPGGWRLLLDRCEPGRGTAVGFRAERWVRQLLPAARSSTSSMRKRRSISRAINGRKYQRFDPLRRIQTDVGTLACHPLTGPVPGAMVYATRGRKFIREGAGMHLVVDHRSGGAVPRLLPMVADLDHPARVSPGVRTARGWPRLIGCELGGPSPRSKSAQGADRVTWGTIPEGDARAGSYEAFQGASSLHQATDDQSLRECQGRAALRLVGMKRVVRPPPRPSSAA